MHLLEWVYRIDTEPVKCKNPVLNVKKIGKTSFMYTLLYHSTKERVLIDILTVDLQVVHFVSPSSQKFSVFEVFNIMYHCSKISIIYLLILFTQKCLGRPQQEELQTEYGLVSKYYRLQIINSLDNFYGIMIFYSKNMTTSSQSEYNLLLNRTSIASTKIVSICGR